MNRTLWLAALLCAACGQVPDDVEAQRFGVLDQPPVRLLWVKTRPGPCASSPCFEPSGLAVGAIEVQNLAPQKKVIVHYKARQAGSAWSDLSARYSGPAAGNREIWTFETPAVQFPQRLSVDFQIALKFVAAGATYWDNNARQNYRVSWGPRPLYGEIVLGAAKVLFEQATTYANTFECRVQVADLAYDKNVTVFYSEDGWKTVQHVEASYLAPASSGLAGGPPAERWSSRAPLAAGTKELVFAIRYEAAGGTYWDNNLGRDYRAAVPGELR